MSKCKGCIYKRWTSGARADMACHYFLDTGQLRPLPYPAKGEPCPVYKAVRKKPNEQAGVQLTCQQCGAEFRTSLPDAKYCSRACYYIGRRKKYIVRRKETGEIVAQGTAKEIAAQMGRTAVSIRGFVSYAARGKNKTYSAEVIE